MTCIAGLVDSNGDIYIGGDSAGVAGYDLTIRADEKVFKKDDMIFGFTSSFRMGQIIRYCFDIPYHVSKKNDFEYLCTDFIRELRECLKREGYARVKDNQVIGGVFLLGYKGSIYKIEGDFQVGKSKRRFDACGCGASYALGAMHVLVKEGELSSLDIIRKSLCVAESFSAGVSAPFVVEKLECVRD